MNANIHFNQFSSSNPSFEEVFRSAETQPLRLHGLRRFLIKNECDYAEDIGERSLIKAVEEITAAREFGLAEFEIIDLTRDFIPSSVMARLILEWVDQGSTEVVSGFH